MQTLIDVVGVAGVDRAPQRNLSNDTLTDHEQKESELKPRLANFCKTACHAAAQPRLGVRVAAGLSTDRRPQNHHRPPADLVVGLAAGQIPSSLRVQQRS